jgi:hypothetical protein
MPADDATFDSTVKVLGVYVGHHVAEEEGELFAMLRHSGLDLAATGEKLASRQLELSTAPLDKHVFEEGRKVLGGRR